MNNELAFKDNTEKQTVSVSQMTTKEVAEVLGVAKDTINATVERLELNGVLRRVDIKRNSQGGYLFDEQQVTMIKQEIAKHHNLASRQIDSATTELEVLQNYKQATEAMIAMLSAKTEALKAENERQAQQLTLQAPKVEMYNALVDRSFCKNLRDTAHFVGEKERHFLAVLQEKSIIYKKGSSYRAYAKYADCFELKTFTYGENKTGQQLLVNVKGLELVKQIFGK